MMPRRDGTGPLGRGAMTGRGLGDCTDANPVGYDEDYGYGGGFRRGIGFKRRVGRGLGLFRRFGSGPRRGSRRGFIRQK